MSTAFQIQRITNARNKIRAKLLEFGLGISTADIDDCAAAIDGIAYIGNVSATVREGDTYKIARGYHDGGTVSAIAGGGSYKLESKTVIPGKSQQTITPSDGFYGLSDVAVNAIPEIYQDVSAVTAGAADVLDGRVIVDKTGKAVYGTMPNNGSASRTIDAMNLSSVSIPAGYTSGGTVSITDSVMTALAAI